MQSNETRDSQNLTTLCIQRDNEVNDPVDMEIEWFCMVL